MSLLGEGGMGRVYLARDSKLGRKAALKVLQNGFTADVERLYQFKQEATAASSLNHPNILTIYDIDEVDGTHYIAAEYIEGETLRQRLDRGALAVGEALDVALQLAEALLAAHTAGIVHRDVKPENVMLRPDGYAKLVDFGLARSLEVRTGAAADGSRITAVTPGADALVGTMRYMSPEQALGRALDARTDIFSFGLVLSETLIGRHPFDGASELDILQGMVHGPIDPLLEECPSPLRKIVERSLRRDPTDRFQSMREIVVELRAARDSAARTRTNRALARPERATQWLAIVTLTSVFVGTGAVVVPRFRPAAKPVPGHYEQLTHFADSATSPTLSPDGRMLAFIRGDSPFVGAGQVYVKRLPDGEPVQLTNDRLPKMGPRFSPDGRRITYATLQVPKRWDTWEVPTHPDQPRLYLANAEGITWVEPGASRPRFMFSEMTGKGNQMAIASSSEGRAQHRTVYLPAKGMAHRSYLSPSGKWVLVAEMDSNGWTSCRVVPYDGSSSGESVGPKPAQCTDTAWSPDEKWMYFSANTGRGSHIWRQRFPNGALEQVTTGATEEEGLEVAPDGRSFITSIGTSQSTLWVHDSRGDRQITSSASAYLPSFSVDGTKLYYLLQRAGGALHSAKEGGGLWVADLETGERQRLLPDLVMQHYTVSPDAKHVVFVAADETGHSAVWVTMLNGGSQPRRVTSRRAVRAFFGAQNDIFFASEEDGHAVVFRSKQDGSEPQQVIPTPVSSLISVSPDGARLAVWVKGSTLETHNAVMVYPANGGSPMLVCGTCAGGDYFFPPLVSWAPDGKFLYLGFWEQATYAVSLQPGQMLPRLPAGGIRSLDDVSALPGAETFPVRGAFVGPSPLIYAYSKVVTHRNIYRVPVP